MPTKTVLLVLEMDEAWADDLARGGAAVASAVVYDALDRDEAFYVTRVLVGSTEADVLAKLKEAGQ